MSSSANVLRCRLRRLGLGLLLLAVPACGLEHYEKLMRETQEREERFREEEKYLDEPVQIPIVEYVDKDGTKRKKPLARVFFRPPKGISPKAPQQPSNGLMWQYRARGKGNDFSRVDLAFADDSQDFANKVVSTYASPDQLQQSSRTITVPEQETQMVFDVWQFSDGANNIYSINVLRSKSEPVAVVYVYTANKARLTIARKVIDVSLQSLAVDQNAGAARERYNRRSPWKLEREAAE